MISPLIHFIGAKNNVNKTMDDEKRLKEMDVEAGKADILGETVLRVRTTSLSADCPIASLVMGHTVQLTHTRHKCILSVQDLALNMKKWVW